MLDIKDKILGISVTNEDGEPFEFENLLTQDVIDFHQLQACQNFAFQHAFAWPYKKPPASLLTGLLKDKSLQRS